MKKCKTCGGTGAVKVWYTRSLFTHDDDGNAETGAALCECTKSLLQGAKTHLEYVVDWGFLNDEKNEEVLKWLKEYKGVWKND